ncbi:MAG: hypothetical protein AAF658_14365, partial [Myxococcota bacterium]
MEFRSVQSLVDAGLQTNQDLVNHFLRGRSWQDAQGEAELYRLSLNTLVKDRSAAIAIPLGDGDGSANEMYAALRGANPGWTRNQDLINFLYEASAEHTFESAAAEGRRYGINIGALTANRDGRLPPVDRFDSVGGGVDARVPSAGKRVGLEAGLEPPSNPGALEPPVPVHDAQTVAASEQVGALPTRTLRRGHGSSGGFSDPHVFLMQEKLDRLPGYSLDADGVFGG